MRTCKTNGWLRRLVRRALIHLDGSDYRERFIRLAEQHALSDVVGRTGSFKPARSKRCECQVTGLVARQYDGDYLIINYTHEDGDFIEGAQIPRSSFRPE